MKTKYYVKGMHCASCEILIEKGLMKLDEVSDAQVSLKNNTVEITAAKQYDAQFLTDKFSDAGYSFYNDKPLINTTQKDVKQVMLIFGLFVFVFLTFEKTSMFSTFSVNANSSVFNYFVFGLLAGVSSCAALVGGLLLSMSKQWNTLYNGNTKESKKPFIYFNVSRIVAFGVLGGVLGLVGTAFKTTILFSTALTIITTLIMLSIGLQMLNIIFFKKFKLALPKKVSKYINTESNFTGKYMPMMIGALTFFLPCGFTLIAQTNALASGSFTQGGLILFAFSLGTLPMLALISFSSFKFYTNPKFAKNFNLFAGLLITFFALYTLNAQLNVLGYPSLSDIKFSAQTTESTALTSDNVQIMQMEATTFEYSPSVINIKAGIPTRWEIYNSGAAGCANAVYARGLYPDVIPLKPGMNIVEFTPIEKGSYKVSCSMGMVPPITVNVN